VLWDRCLVFVLCCGLVFGTVRATPPTEVAEVADRWLAAIGGERKVASARSVFVRSDSSEDGVPGQVEEWIEGDSWRRVTTEAGRKREESCRGRTAWIKDSNGKVLELQGQDRRDQLTEAAIDSLLFGAAIRELTSGGMAQLSDADDGTSKFVLTFTPPDALPFTLFLDKATSLPTRVVRKPAADTITQELSDWRTVKGRKVPFSVRITTGDDSAPVTTTVKEVRVGKRAATVPIGRPADGPTDVKFASGAKAGGIPFNFENNHLMVLGRVNGSKPLWFMLDTGAEATIVNKARLAELKVEAFGASAISGGGNTTDFAFADVGRLEIGGVALLGQRDGVIDLSGLEKIYGMPMGGLLGYDFFSRFVVRVDYDTKTIDLFEPSGFVYDGAGIAVPFVLEGRCPHVLSTITVPTVPPIPADMIVDAGAADTVNLTSPFVKANRLLELARKKPAGGPNTMAGSEKEFFAQTSVRGKLGAFTLGTFTLTDIPGNLMVGTTGAYASESFSGTIGEGVLSRFTTFYDYSRSVMILEPNAEFEKPFAGRKTFGATLLSDGPNYTKFTVTGIRKDGPAEAAGLRKNDLIVAADGKPAEELRLADVRKLLTDEGARHALTVRRGDETVTVEFVVTLVSLDEI
jgi:hypothetical protein